MIILHLQEQAYTQYGEIKVNDSADLIIAEGDDVIPDVLGLAEFGTVGGGPSAGRMRVNTITNACSKWCTNCFKWTYNFRSYNNI